MTNFTPEELLLYLYKESAPQLTAQIRQAIDTDWTLREKLSVLESSIKSLEKIRETPRTESVLQVLNYAKESFAEEVQ